MGSWVHFLCYRCSSVALFPFRSATSMLFSDFLRENCRPNYLLSATTHLIILVLSGYSCRWSSMQMSPRVGKKFRCLTSATCQINSCSMHQWPPPPSILNTRQVMNTKNACFSYTFCWFYCILYYLNVAGSFVQHQAPTPPSTLLYSSVSSSSWCKWLWHKHPDS